MSRRKTARSRRASVAAGVVAALSFLADVSGSTPTGATLSNGQALTAWGIASTAVGAPKLCDDTVAGGKVVRTSASDKLQTVAGAAGFMSLAPSTAILIFRTRKWHSGTTYPIFDTTEAGTKAGYQLRVYDNDADFFATRLIAVRVFDGSTWTLDVPVAFQAGLYIPQKLIVVSVRLSGSQWELRIDGKSTTFSTNTISLSFPGAATGKAEIGGGPVDYKAVFLYSRFLSDADLASETTRLASRFNIRLVNPVAGLINVASPTFPQYTAFPWATTLAGGIVDVTAFNGDTESPASNTYVTDQKSSDGGRTFTAPTTIFSSTSTVSEAGAWTLRMSNGTCLRIGYTWDIGTGLGKQIWAQISSDGGLTYAARSNITIGTPALVQLGGAPVEDPGNPGHIFFAVFQGAAAGPWDSIGYKSVNFGATWALLSTPIGNGVVDGRSYAEPQLLFHSSGELRCLIRDYTSGNGSGMCMTRSLDGGATWAAPSGKIADATSAGQSYVQLASGREVWLGRPINILTLGFYHRPPGSAWNDAWLPLPPFNTSANAALFIDPRPGEMVYGTILETSPGKLALYWGTFTGSAPNTIADVVDRIDFDEWILTRSLPGSASPTTRTLARNTTQQLTVTGAGDEVYAITSDTGGGCSVSAGGLFTAGNAAGTCIFTVKDLNAQLLATCTYTVT